MNSNKIIKVKQSIYPAQNLPISTQSPVLEELISPQGLEVEQPESIAQIEPVAEIPPDESVFGCGWSVTELRKEFSGRQ